MKNNDLKEIQPIYIQECNNSTNDEINLIDLALILINRKALISLIIAGFIVIGIIIASVIPKNYSFSTSLEIGSQIINGSVKPFESAQTLLAKLQHSFIPLILRDHRNAEPEDKKNYKVKLSIPRNSDIIVLSISGPSEQDALMKKLLNGITQKAILDHDRIFISVSRNIKSQLEQKSIELSKLGSGSYNLAEKASLLRSIEGFSSQLANLRNTREILPPIRSLEPSGINRKLIVIISAISGFFIAIFAAFFVEFAVKVREKQNNSTY